MYKVITTHSFKKDYKKILKSGKKDVQKIDDIMRKLANGEKLDIKNKDHNLHGNYKGYRECHIEPDWLLIYKVAGKDIFFTRTGSHPELYG